MLTYLLQDEPPDDDKPAGPEAPRVRLPGWWGGPARDGSNFERRTSDPGDPVTGWVAFLLPGAAADPLACPRCGRKGTLQSTLGHLLRDHDAGYGEAAGWLEAADPDLYTLAIHYLAGKARGISSRE